MGGEPDRYDLPSSQFSYGILAVTVACRAYGPVPVISLQGQSNDLSDMIIAKRMF